MKNMVLIKNEAGSFQDICNLGEYTGSEDYAHSL